MIGDHTYTARIIWRLTEGEFRRGRYSRQHTWEFDGGVAVPASPSPHVVRPPYSNPDCVDPEEALVAAISSCHMLAFLHVASRAGFVVERYEDDPAGTMTKNERGVPWLSHVELRPRITYAEDATPSAQEVAQLHGRAHEECYIAASVKTEITVRV